MSDLPEDSQPDEIIGGLESIKDLLDGQRSTPDTSDANNPETKVTARDGSDDVPLLDDPIVEAAEYDEGMADDTFKTLLGDAWQDSVDELLTNARANIQRNSTTWLPEHTDELSQALKVRIDTSVKAWLAETLVANIGLLRERIVTELSGELLEQLREKLTTTEDIKETEQDHGQ